MLSTVLEGDSDATSPQTSTPYQGVTLGTRRSAYPDVEAGSTNTARSEIAKLKTAIRYLEVRAKQAKRTLKDKRRRQSRASIARAASAGESFQAYASPKLTPPWTFAGAYSELVNMLNWFSTVEKYLDQTRTDPEDWLGYASTYTGTSPKVQAWFYVTFTDLSPPWEEVREEMTNRYLPDDHRISLDLRL
eukprot:744780-Rhodomonas_salina.1